MDWDWVVATGASCLGVLIGLFVAYFIFELKVMNHKALHAAVGVIGGAGVIAVFHLLGGLHDPRSEYWLYPIGLLIGYILGTIYEWIAPPEVYDVILKKRLERLKRSSSAS